MLTLLLTDNSGKIDSCVFFLPWQVTHTVEKEERKKNTLLYQKADFVTISVTSLLVRILTKRPLKVKHNIESCYVLTTFIKPTTAPVQLHGA